jgi:O-antigen/teichoic acid export membrane protein
MKHREDARHTLRQVGGLAVQRVFEVAAGMLFVSVIPRYMGPESYGKFSLLYSMSLWFALMGGMGAVSMMVRFVPEFRERGDEAGLRRLMGGMLALRMVNGCLGGIAYIFLAMWWVGSNDVIALVAMAAGISVRTAGNLSYTLFLGLNQGARWGMAETLRRTLVLPTVLAGYYLSGIRGACLSILAVELVVLLLGLWWARDYILWSNLRIDREFLRPYLRFSTAFFASNLLLVLFQQGGGPLVHLVSGKFAEAGFYTIAFSAYLAVTQATWRLVNGFGSFFSSLRAKSEIEVLTQWVERLLKLFAVIAVMGLAATHTLAGPVVRLALGPQFEPVTAQLLVMSFAGLWFGPAALARILAVVYNQPRVSFVGAIAQLAVFAGLCVVLVPRDPNWGASIAALVATTVFAINGIVSMRQVIRFSMRRWGMVMLLGMVCSPLVWMWSGNAVLRLAVFSATFLTLLIATRVVTTREFADLRRPALDGDGLE